MKHFMSNTAIRVEKLSKEYKVAGAKYRNDTLRDTIMDGLKSVFRSKESPHSFWALKDVTFEVERGQMVGIIGHNGAGKSTLLKILSRITQPTLGRGEIFGRVGSLLEVGTGFHYELTGRENIYLNGAIIGMTTDQIRSKFDAIVDFAEVGEFIDTPVKHYSSGMYVRLAFAVSAHLKPEILLLDEVLSVGDIQFQRKCMAYAEELRKSDATILLVSHNMFVVKSMCSRVILLSEGKVKFDGSPADAIQVYEQDSKVSPLSWAKDSLGTDPSQWDISLTEMDTLDENGQQKNLFNYGERMKIRLKFNVRRTINNPNILVSFIRSDNVACCNYNTIMDGITVPSGSNDFVIELLTPPLKLVSESYNIYVLVRDDKFERLYCAQAGKIFHVRHDLLNTHFGVFHEPGEWFIPSGVVDHQSNFSKEGLHS